MTESKKRGRPKGYKVSTETKEKISDYRLGTTHTIKTKKKMSQSKTGKKRKPGLKRKPRSKKPDLIQDFINDRLGLYRAFKAAYLTGTIPPNKFLPAYKIADRYGNNARLLFKEFFQSRMVTDFVTIEYWKNKWINLEIDTAQYKKECAKCFSWEWDLKPEYIFKIRDIMENDNDSKSENLKKIFNLITKPWIAIDKYSPSELLKLII